MMRFRWAVTVIGLGVMLGFGTVGWAQCPPDCPIPGGKDATQDCQLEFATTRMQLNYPFFNPAKVRPAKEVRCFDGDPGCDLDGQTNGECLFDVDVCLFNADPKLPSCTPAQIDAAKVGATGKYAGLASLQAAIDALLPAASSVCTTGQQVSIPLKGPTSKGTFKRGKQAVTIKAVTSLGTVDKNKLKLSCVPREWPVEGYDHRNSRYNPRETQITPANASTLVQKWDIQIGGSGQARGVSSATTVGEKLLYVTAWDGKVHALKKKDGIEKWAFDTGSGFSIADNGLFRGIQGSATLTAEGRLLVTDRNANVFCVDAKKGKLLWQANVGNPSQTTGDAAHGWTSPVVANGRVFVGRASHSDAPCTPGHLYAFDLDTGTELWRLATVPDKVCIDDTSIECADDSDCGVSAQCLSNVCSNDYTQPCTVNGDCPGGQCLLTGACEFDTARSCTTNADCHSCLTARGGGVTGTPTVDADGETVYAATVGCLSFPSVGNSDSILSVDAATGTLNWAYRGVPTEQFDETKNYHDYGFLNGPVLAEVDDGLGGTADLVVAGGKHGTLHAVERASGAVVWTNELAPAPPFAGSGLFSAGLGVFDGKIYAAVSDIDFANWTSGDDHMWAFDGLTGSPAWSELMETSWGDVAIANGVVAVGSGFIGQQGHLYLFDAQTGAQLQVFTLPGPIAAGPSFADGTLYVGYGLFGTNPFPAGLRAFGLP